MKLNIKKVLLLLTASLTLFGFEVNSTFALDNVCPGEPTVLYWTALGVSSCSPTSPTLGGGSIPSCNFTVVPGSSNSSTIYPAASCTATLTCEDMPVTDSLTVNPNQERCCGKWALSGSPTWSGAACVAAAVMSGTLTLSASTCTIALNQSSCSVNATWTTTNPVGTSAVTSSPGGTVYTANNGGPSPVSITGVGSKNFYLYNNGNQLDTTKTLTATCALGTSWVGGICASAGSVPTVSVSWLPTSITVGGSSNINVSSTNATACFGTAGSLWVGDLGGTATPPGGTNSGVINSVGTVTQGIYCTGPGGTSATVTANLTVNAAAQAGSCTGSVLWGGCNYPFSGVPSGSSVVSTNVNAGYTGSGTISCNNGTPASSNLTCTANGPSDDCGPLSSVKGAPPQVTAPTGSNACWSGAYSSAATDPSYWIWNCGSIQCNVAKDLTGTDCAGRTVNWGSCTGTIVPNVVVSSGVGYTYAIDNNSYSTLNSYVGSAQYTCTNGVLSAPTSQSCDQILCTVATDASGAYAPCSGVCANGGTPYPSCPRPAGPDLTAGNTTAKSAFLGIPLSLSANVMNIGRDATPGSFNNFFQMVGYNSSGVTISDTRIGDVIISPVVDGDSSGVLATTQTFNAFPPGGAVGYLYRLCVDKSSSTDTGTIAELNENNNCGGFSSITIQACANGTTNNPACDQCPANLYWTGTGCAPCNYGGCTGPGGNPVTPVPPGLICNNGANNAWQCNQCPANLAWDGISNSCIPCYNGGCTGTTGGSSASPVGNLVCNNKSTASPFVCSYSEANPNPCYILDGASTCTSVLSFAADPRYVASPYAMTPVGTRASGQSTDVQYGANNFVLGGYTPDYGDSVLNWGSIPVNGQCLAGSTFDAGGTNTCGYNYFWRCTDYFNAFVGDFGPSNPTCDAGTVGNVRGGYSFDWDTGQVTGTDLCTCMAPPTPLPDLTTGLTDKIVFAYNTATVVTAQVKNIGNTDLTGTFKTFFQTATDPNGTGAITDHSGTTITNLASAQSKPTQHTFTFTSAQTGSMRACANSSDSNWSDRFGTEQDNNNNCGPWVNFTALAPPTGSLTAVPPTCSIAVGSNSCNTNLTWSTVGTAGAVEVTSNNPFAINPIRTGVSGGPTSVSVRGIGATTFYLYNSAIELASTTVTTSCVAGGWDTVSTTCRNPLVQNVIVTGEYYSTPGNLNITCTNSNGYAVHNTASGPPYTLVQSGAYAGVPVNVPVTSTGNYQVTCSYGSVIDTRVSLYNSPPPGPATVSVIASSRTVNSGGSSLISWNVHFPPILPKKCVLTGKAVCANNACSAAQNTYNTELSTQLLGNTDPSSPGGSVPIATSVTTVTPGNTDFRAIGKKTITNIKYTTDFTLSCESASGVISETKTRVFVTKNEEQ